MLEEKENGDLVVKSAEREKVRRQLEAYQSARQTCSLLEVHFTSLSDYLWLLRAACQSLAPLGSRAMLYLAAAVADFYIPAGNMPEHKMQSSEGAPEVHLALVPKMLAPLVKDWVPKAFVVSFKLETDPDLLVPKAKQALKKYGHRIVVGNLLHTRKNRVLLVSAVQEQPCEVVLTEKEAASGKEIEEKIVLELKRLHSEFCRTASESST